MADKQEIIPGLSRQATIIGGVALVVYLVLMVTFISIGTSRRNAKAAERAEAEAASAQLGTAIAQETANVIIASETAVAVATNTPNLPPTWTPTFTVEPTISVAMQSTALPPPPADLVTGGVLVGYGGATRSSEGFRSLLSFSLDEPGTFREINNRAVNSVAIHPANGDVIVYTRFNTVDFYFNLEIANRNGEAIQRLADSWQGIELIIRSDQPEFSLNTNKLVFVGSSDDTLTREIWVLDMNFTPGQSPLRRVTNDAADYYDPAISPDGTLIVAVKVDPNSLEGGTDLVIIDATSGVQTPLTSDGGTLVEADPKWLPNGTDIAYVVAQNTPDATSDIIRVSANVATGGAPAPPLYIVRDVEGFDDVEPVFSPDGRYMAFASDRFAGVYNVFIKDLETDAIYQLTSETLNPVFPNDWYHPGIAAPRPAVLPVPTPFIPPTPEEQ